MARISTTRNESASGSISHEIKATAGMRKTATCALEASAISAAIVIFPRAATTTAPPCSAALPTIATITAATKEALAGKAIGAQTGTTHSQAAEALFPDSDVKVYPTAEEYKLDIGNGRVDAVMDAESLDAIVAPTGSPSWPIDLVNGDHFLGGSSSYAAMAGYPLVTVPMGTSFGLPVGITFMGRAWSEPTLIKLASGFEAGVPARTRPEFLSTLPDPGPTRPPRQRSLTRQEALDLFHRH